MRKLLSIILGVIIFMAPLSAYAVTVYSWASITMNKEYVVNRSTAQSGGTGKYTYYVFTAPAGSTLYWDESENMYRAKLNGVLQTMTANYTHNGSAATYHDYPMILSQLQGATWYPQGSNTNPGALASNPIVKSSREILNYATNASFYSESVNYTVNVGETAHFALNPGNTSESITAHSNGYTANLTIKTVNSANASSTGEYTVTSTLTAVTSKSIDVTVNSSGTNDPGQQWVVISSTMPMTIIGTGGVIDDPSTMIDYLDDSPDTVTFMNRTGVTQYIHVTRTTAGDNQYFLGTWSQLHGSTYSLVGSSPMVKDTQARNLPVKNGQNLQLYNHGGTTKYEYPVVDGLDLVTSVRGSNYVDTEGPNLGIGEVPLGGSPDLQTPIPDPSEYENSIPGFMQWIKDTVSGMFSNILESLQSVVSTVVGFSGQVGSLGQITGDFMGFPAWMVGLITLGITLPIIAGIICRRLL